MFMIDSEFRSSLVYTYAFPLYFLAKVKVKKERICISKLVHANFRFIFKSEAKVIYFCYIQTKNDIFFIFLP